MNKQRRNDLRTVYAKIRDAKDDLASLTREEQMSLDAIPDNLQGSERAEKMEDAIDAMDNATDALQEALSYLDEVV
ncbi:MAG: hypothetical protein NC131_16030 [Roseburia sp.]|nr:hypothetical protein [Roseburia sp.]